MASNPQKVEGDMNITKHSTNTYKVLQAFANKPIFRFGNFKESRLRQGMSISLYEKCFACNHRFTDDEQTYFGTAK